VGLYHLSGGRACWCGYASFAFLSEFAVGEEAEDAEAAACADVAVGFAELDLGDRGVGVCGEIVGGGAG
jgi:hypothetical protein